MSNYEANPVGFLYERYQSSGISPIYEVKLKRGQAHAPIFEAVLNVPGGGTVTATGSSKKIAKNIAAKMMLDQLKLNSEKQEEDVGGNQNNNSLHLSEDSAVSVGEFYRRLLCSRGEILDKLTSGEICLAGDIQHQNYVAVLDTLAEEQEFLVKYLELESVEGVEQSLVQILDEGIHPAVTVCLGQGPGSKNSAARCALMYIKTMAKPVDQ